MKFNGYVVCYDELQGAGSVPELVVEEIVTVEEAEFQGDDIHEEIGRMIARCIGRNDVAEHDVYVFPIGERIKFRKEVITPPVKEIVNYVLDK